MPLEEGKMVVATVEQLKWNQLRKQFLLDERPRDFYHVAVTQLGLHSTNYWTPYLSVWARLGDYDAKKMFESLDNGKKIVRTHAFRTTLHVIHIENLSLIISATGPSLFRASRMDKYRKVDQLSDKQIEDMLDQVKSALADGPLRTSDLKRAVPKVGDYVRSALVMLMARGEVVRAKAKHARSNLTSYALVDEWVQGFQLEIMDEKMAIARLIKCHLGRFGPSSVDDLAWWLRQTKTSVNEAIKQLGDDVASVEVREIERYILSEDLEAASSLEAPTEDFVWFLPYEDHFLKAFTDRTGFISDELQHFLCPADRRHFWPSDPDGYCKMPSVGVRATGEVRPSIWLNGQVIGRWELDDEGSSKRVVTSLYSKVTKSQQTMIKQVSSELEDFINSSLVPISS